MIDKVLLELLRSVDTPTVCNAIEVVQGRRGFAGFTRGTTYCSAPTDPPIVGRAVTARIAASRPPAEDPAVIRARRLDYYRAVANASAPAVAVIEDVDFPNCVGAFWGELNATIHKGFGATGALTNGVMRDLGDLPDGFPILAGSVGPSHGFVHVIEIGAPVTVFGLTVTNGQLIHADRHGAVAVPEDVLDNLAAAIGRLRATERIVLDTAKGPDFDFDSFETAWAAFEAART